VSEAGNATERLLALGVVASTMALVRAMEKGGEPELLQDMMQERRRLLGELARKMDTYGDAGSLAALSAAVAESDRTLGAMIG
jgi:hypothetical protein